MTWKIWRYAVIEDEILVAGSDKFEILISLDLEIISLLILRIGIRKFCRLVKQIYCWNPPALWLK